MNRCWNDKWPGTEVFGEEFSIAMLTAVKGKGKVPLWGRIQH
jgi:hypothetical protein